MLKIPQIAGLQEQPLLHEVLRKIHENALTRDDAPLLSSSPFNAGAARQDGSIAISGLMDAAGGLRIDQSAPGLKFGTPNQNGVLGENGTPSGRPFGAAAVVVQRRDENLPQFNAGLLTADLAPVVYIEALCQSGSPTGGVWPLVINMPGINSRCVATLKQDIAPGGPQTVTVDTTVGMPDLISLLAVDTQPNLEFVTIEVINATTIRGTFAKSHLTGATLRTGGGDKVGEGLAIWAAAGNTANIYGTNPNVGSYSSGQHQVCGVEIDVGNMSPVDSVTEWGNGPMFVGQSILSAGTKAAYKAINIGAIDDASSWYYGVSVSAAKSAAFATFRGPSVAGRPDTGLWVAAAKSYGIYVGNKPLYPANPMEAPNYDINQAPNIGIVLGARTVTNGDSNILRFIATGGLGVEENWDLQHIINGGGTGERTLTASYGAPFLELSATGNLRLRSQMSPAAYTSGKGLELYMVGAAGDLGVIRAYNSGGSAYLPLALYASTVYLDINALGHLTYWDTAGTHIQAPTATMFPLTVKTTDNSATNPVLRTVTSTDVTRFAVNKDGMVAITPPAGTHAVIQMTGGAGREWSLNSNYGGSSPNGSGFTLRDDSAGADRLRIDINGTAQLFNTLRIESSSHVAPASGKGLELYMETAAGDVGVFRSYNATGGVYLPMWLMGSQIDVRINAGSDPQTTWTTAGTLVQSNLTTAVPLTVKALDTGANAILNIVDSGSVTRFMVKKDASTALIAPASTHAVIQMTGGGGRQWSLNSNYGGSSPNGSGFTLSDDSAGADRLRVNTNGTMEMFNVFRCTGGPQDVHASGKGLELCFNSGSDCAVIMSVDRTAGTTYKPALVFFENMYLYSHGANQAALWDQDGYLHLKRCESASTTQTIAVTEFGHKYTGGGTVGNGFGGTLRLVSDDNGAQDAKAGEISWEWTNATHASRTSKVKLSAADSIGTTPGFIVEADGAGAPKIAFFNGAPQARPTQAAWTGTANTATKDTASASLVDCAQTIKSMIDYFRAMGLFG